MPQYEYLNERIAGLEKALEQIHDLSKGISYPQLIQIYQLTRQALGLISTPETIEKVCIASAAHRLSYHVTKPDMQTVWSVLFDIARYEHSEEPEYYTHLTAMDDKALDKLSEQVLDKLLDFKAWWSKDTGK